MAQPPFVVGLTGGVAMGKSTVGAVFRDQGFPLLDSDQVVKSLYAPGGAAVAPVSAEFPAVLSPDRGIDPQKLSRCVLGNPAALAKLESIVHPLVVGAQREFIESHSGQDVDGESQTSGRASDSPPIVILDIPLLFETGAHSRCDAVVAVSCPAAVQWDRAMLRAGMTEQKLRAILARQASDDTRRAGAHIVIDTGVSVEETRALVDQAAATLKHMAQDKREQSMTKRSSTNTA